MIATKELELTIEGAEDIARAYITTAFDENYFTSNGKKHDDGWHFMVNCHREDMNRTPAVGGIFVCASGKVETLSEDRIREMTEAVEVQAAQKRGELARDANGYVLRYHARIKANSWTTNHIDHKVGAKGGVFIPAEEPIWRFSIKDSLADADDHTFDVIDVDAKTGEVNPLSQERLNNIFGGLRAARGIKKQTAAA